MQHFDNTGQYHTPSAFSLSVMETAALHDEHRGIIHTALFKLWQEDAISIKGKAKNARVLSNKHCKDNISLNDDIEKVLYSYISNQSDLSVRVKKFFLTRSPFYTQLNIALDAIYSKLEKRHLRCNDETLLKRKLIKFLVPLIIFTVGSLKLGFGLWYGHPVLILILLLIIIPPVAWFILPNVDRQTVLGRRYLAQCRSKFDQSSLLRNENDGLYRVAVFGVSGIESWVVFESYNNAFAAPYNKSWFHSGNGGCGGGISGCGGGSGECGGGGGCGGCGGA